MFFITWYFVENDFTLLHTILQIFWHMHFSSFQHTKSCAGLTWRWRSPGRRDTRWYLWWEPWPSECPALWGRTQRLKSDPDHSGSCYREKQILWLSQGQSWWNRFHSSYGDINVAHRVFYTITPHINRYAGYIKKINMITENTLSNTSVCEKISALNCIQCALVVYLKSKKYIFLKKILAGNIILLK